MLRDPVQQVGDNKYLESTVIMLQHDVIWKGAIISNQIRHIYTQAKPNMCDMAAPCSPDFTEQHTYKGRRTQTLRVTCFQDSYLSDSCDFCLYDDGVLLCPSLSGCFPATQVSSYVYIIHNT